MMSKLKDLILEAQSKHVSNVLECLKQDPMADESDINYLNTEDYLYEIIEKDGCLLNGLIAAMETYLKK